MKIVEALPVATPRTITAEEYAVGKNTITMHLPREFNLQVDSSTIVVFPKGDCEVPAAESNVLRAQGGHVYGVIFSEDPKPYPEASHTPSLAQSLAAASAGVNAALRSKA